MATHARSCLSHTDLDLASPSACVRRRRRPACTRECRSSFRVADWGHPARRPAHRVCWFLRSRLNPPPGSEMVMQAACLNEFRLATCPSRCGEHRSCRTEKLAVAPIASPCLSHPRRTLEFNARASSSRHIPPFPLTPRRLPRAERRWSPCDGYRASRFAPSGPRPTLETGPDFPLGPKWDRAGKESRCRAFGESQCQSGWFDHLLPKRISKTVWLFVLFPHPALD